MNEETYRSKEVVVDGRSIKLPELDVPPYSFEPDQRQIILSLLPDSGKCGARFITQVEQAATTLKGSHKSAAELLIPSPAKIRGKMERIEFTTQNLRDLLQNLEECVELHTIARAIALFSNENAYPLIDDMIRKLTTLNECLKKMLGLNIRDFQASYGGDPTTITTADQLSAHIVAQSLKPITSKKGRPRKEGEINFIRSVAHHYKEQFNLIPDSSRSGRFCELCSTLLQAILPDEYSESPDAYRLVQQAVKS